MRLRPIPTHVLVIMLIACALVVLTACTPTQVPAPPHPDVNVSAQVLGCHYGHDGASVLPDVRCTPGTTDPRVTQATIAQTICQRGWTANVRPPVSWTNWVKARSKVSYGQSPSAVGELDHLIPLELGGAPADTLNLWFEPGPIPNPKDRVENDLHRRVCEGVMSLAAAQAAIRLDWATAEPR